MSLNQVRLRKDERGFTLTEMLVSCAVLVLLVVLIAQLTSTATSTTTLSRKRMDADSQARLIFDRMANDFAKMPIRKDVDYVFNKDAGNDSIFFYSEAPGYSADLNSGNANRKSSYTLVGYRINTTTYQLERLGKALAWDGAVGAGNPGSPVFLSYPPPSPPPAASPAPYAASTLAGAWPATVAVTSQDVDFHAIGDQVYRLETCFLLSDGTYSNKPSLPPSTATAVNGFKDVSAIVVALAILDSSSQNLIVSKTGIVAALPDSASADLTGNPPKLMAKTWNDAVLSGRFASISGIPQAAAAQVRIYQRIFYLNKSNQK